MPITLPPALLWGFACSPQGGFPFEVRTVRGVSVQAVEPAPGKVGHLCLYQVSMQQGLVAYGCQQGLRQPGSPGASFRLCDDLPSTSAVTELLGAVVPVAKCTKVLQPPSLWSCCQPLNLLCVFCLNASRWRPAGSAAQTEPVCKMRRKTHRDKAPEKNHLAAASKRQIASTKTPP